MHKASMISPVLKERDCNLFLMVDTKELNLFIKKYALCIIINDGFQYKVYLLNWEFHY